MLGEGGIVFLVEVFFLVLVGGAGAFFWGEARVVLSVLSSLSAVRSRVAAGRFFLELLLVLFLFLWLLSLCCLFAGAGFLRGGRDELEQIGRAFPVGGVVEAFPKCELASVMSCCWKAIEASMACWRSRMVLRVAWGPASSAAAGRRAGSMGLGGEGRVAGWGGVVSSLILGVILGGNSGVGSAISFLLSRMQVRQVTEKNFRLRGL